MMRYIYITDCKLPILLEIASLWLRHRLLHLFSCCLFLLVSSIEHSFSIVFADLLLLLRVILLFLLVLLLLVLVLFVFIFVVLVLILILLWLILILYQFLAENHIIACLIIIRIESQSFLIAFFKAGYTLMTYQLLLALMPQCASQKNKRMAR